MGKARSSRPKGFSPWRPHLPTRQLLEQVSLVLEEYYDYLPMTSRQVFYRLVGAFDYAKTDEAYNRLCEHLVRARRAGMIPFDSIRDDGMYVRPGGGYYSFSDFWDHVGLSINTYKSERLEGQPYHIEIWCESGGMLPQLARVAGQYSVSAYSTGGFSSVTVTHNVARRVASRNRPTVFLQVGDHDPSGVAVYEALTKDIAKFVEQMKDGWATSSDNIVNQASGFIPERIAVTPEQIEEYNLDTEPPKEADSRTENWVGQTCQAEALSPRDLEKIIKSGILKHIDQGILDEVLVWESVDKHNLSKTFNDVGHDLYSPRLGLPR